MSRPRKQAVFVLPFLFLLAAAAAARAQSQPIAFSHRLHTATNGISCLFCHSGAAKTAVAGVPSVAKCMICHRSIAVGKPEVKKLAQYWNEKKPIPWVRATELPDYTYFPHFRMVNAGVACLACHPGIDRMDAAVQEREFKMGWCLSCHRSRGVSIDCWTCHI